MEKRTSVTMATETSVVTHNSCAHYTWSLTYQNFYRFALRQDESLPSMSVLFFPLTKHCTIGKRTQAKSTPSKSQRGKIWNIDGKLLELLMWGLRCNAHGDRFVMVADSHPLWKVVFTLLDNRSNSSADDSELQKDKIRLLEYYKLS